MERLDPDFHVPRRQRRVHRVLRTGDDGTGDGHHAFDAYGFNGGEEFCIAGYHNLGQAVVVAKIHEQQPAVITLRVHPSRQAHGRADVLGAEFAAVVGPVRMHGEVSRGPSAARARR